MTSRLSQCVRGGGAPARDWAGRAARGAWRRGLMEAGQATAAEVRGAVPPPWFRGNLVSNTTHALFKIGE